MTFETKTRYGSEETYESDAKTVKVITELLDELTNEEFDEADDEHTQVAVSNGDWAITVEVSGLVTLDDLSWITGSMDDEPTESLHMRDVPRDRLVLLLKALAESDFKAVLKAGWVPIDQLPAYERDYYRQPDPGPQ